MIGLHAIVAVVKNCGFVRTSCTLAGVMILSLDLWLSFFSSSPPPAPPVHVHTIRSAASFNLLHESSATRMFHFVSFFPFSSYYCGGNPTVILYWKLW